MGCTGQQKLVIERILLKDLLISNNEHAKSKHVEYYVAILRQKLHKAEESERSLRNTH